MTHSLSLINSCKNALISWFRKTIRILELLLDKKISCNLLPGWKRFAAIEATDLRTCFYTWQSGVRKGKERFRWRRSRFRRLSRVSPEVAAVSSDWCLGQRLPNNISWDRYSICIIIGEWYISAGHYFWGFI